MGTISINGLRLLGRHGVAEQERRVGNEFQVDIRLDVPCSDRAMASDSLADTINYARVVELVREEMSHPSALIEAVAGRIRRRLDAEFPGLIVSGEITVAKLAPPIPAQLTSVAFTTRWKVTIQPKDRHT